MAEIIKRLPGYEFDIITAKLDKKLKDQEHYDNVHIYRLGAGSAVDKYLLPLRAVSLAKKLHRQNSYQLSWAIMASYGAVAASLFSSFNKRVPFLLSVYEGDLTAKMTSRGRLLSPVYKMIFSKAHRWQLIAKMNQQQRAWLENERRVQVVQFEKDFDLLAKRTKEMFQELEILSARI
ncbi:MAG: glycosyltransferase [Candidatus Komeilibacteria bacterium]|nr:glycosyltransferase [Candidatus Komeilibacteria bacterium]